MSSYREQYQMRLRNSMNEKQDNKLERYSFRIRLLLSLILLLGYFMVRVIGAEYFPIAPDTIEGAIKEDLTNDIFDFVDNIHYTE